MDAKIRRMGLSGGDGRPLGQGNPDVFVAIDRSKYNFRLILGPIAGITIDKVGEPGVPSMESRNFPTRVDWPQY